MKLFTLILIFLALISFSLGQDSCLEDDLIDWPNIKAVSVSQEVTSFYKPYDTGEELSYKITVEENPGYELQFSITNGPVPTEWAVVGRGSVVEIDDVDYIEGVNNTLTIKVRENPRGLVETIELPAAIPKQPVVTLFPTYHDICGVNGTYKVTAVSQTFYSISYVSEICLGDECKNAVRTYKDYSNHPEWKYVSGQTFSADFEVADSPDTIELSAWAYAREFTYPSVTYSGKPQLSFVPEYTFEFVYPGSTCNEDGQPSLDFLYLDSNDEVDVGTNVTGCFRGTCKPVRIRSTKIDFLFDGPIPLTNPPEEDLNVTIITENCIGTNIQTLDVYSILEISTRDTTQRVCPGDTAINVLAELSEMAYKLTDSHGTSELCFLNSTDQYECNPSEEKFGTFFSNYVDTLSNGEGYGYWNFTLCDTSWTTDVNVTAVPIEIEKPISPEIFEFNYYIPDETCSDPSTTSVEIDIRPGPVRGRLDYCIKNLTASVESCQWEDYSEDRYGNYPTIWAHGSPGETIEVIARGKYSGKCFPSKEFNTSTQFTFPPTTSISISEISVKPGHSCLQHSSVPCAPSTTFSGDIQVPGNPFNIAYDAGGIYYCFSQDENCEPSAYISPRDMSWSHDILNPENGTFDNYYFRVKGRICDIESEIKQVQVTLDEYTPDTKGNSSMSVGLDTNQCQIDIVFSETRDFIKQIDYYHYCFGTEDEECAYSWYEITYDQQVSVPIDQIRGEGPVVVYAYPSRCGHTYRDQQMISEPLTITPSVSFDSGSNIDVEFTPSSDCSTYTATISWNAATGADRYIVCPNRGFDCITEIETEETQITWENLDIASYGNRDLEIEVNAYTASSCGSSGSTGPSATFRPATPECYQPPDEIPDNVRRILAGAPPAPAIVTSFGDPHLVSTDGQEFSYNGLGEYLLVRGTNSNSTLFELQGFFEKAETDSISGSIITGIAVKYGTEKLEFYQEAGLFLNDEQVPIETESGATRLYNKRFADIETKSNGNEIQIGAKSSAPAHEQFSLKLLRGNKELSFAFSLPQTLYKHSEGLLGLWDGNKENDFTTSDGTHLSIDSTEAELYSFGKSWRIDNIPNAPSSLFHMSLDPNGDPTAFTPTFASDLDLNNLDSTVQASCSQFQSNEKKMRRCVLDVSATNDPSIAETQNTVEEKQNELVQQVVKVPSEVAHIWAKNIDGNSAFLQWNDLRIQFIGSPWFINNITITVDVIDDDGNVVETFDQLETEFQSDGFTLTGLSASTSYRLTATLTNSNGQQSPTSEPWSFTTLANTESSSSSSSSENNGGSDSNSDGNSNSNSGGGGNSSSSSGSGNSNGSGSNSNGGSGSVSGSNGNGSQQSGSENDENSMGTSIAPNSMFLALIFVIVFTIFY